MKQLIDQIDLIIHQNLLIDGYFASFEPGVPETNRGTILINGVSYYVMDDRICKTIEGHFIPLTDEQRCSIVRAYDADYSKLNQFLESTLRPYHASVAGIIDYVDFVYAISNMMFMLSTNHSEADNRIVIADNMKELPGVKEATKVLSNLYDNPSYKKVIHLVDEQFNAYRGERVTAHIRHTGYEQIIKYRNENNIAIYTDVALNNDNTLNELTKAIMFINDIANVIRQTVTMSIKPTDNVETAKGAQEATDELNSIQKRKDKLYDRISRILKLPEESYITDMFVIKGRSTLAIEFCTKDNSSLYGYYQRTKVRWMFLHNDESPILINIEDIDDELEEYSLIVDDFVYETVRLRLTTSFMN